MNPQSVPETASARAPQLSTENHNLKKG